MMNNRTRVKIAVTSGIISVFFFMLISGIRSETITETETLRRFFHYTANREMSRAWNMLTEKSKKQFSTELANKTNSSPAAVRKVLDNPKSKTSEAFWENFSRASKAAIIKRDGTFSLVESKGNQAVVSLKIGSKEIKYLLFKEGKIWKVGYVESFSH